MSGPGSAGRLCYGEAMRESGYISTEDGVRLYFEQSGNTGKPLLIPNGAYLLGDFEPLAADYTLITWDPRNRGRSDSVPGDIGRDVDDIESVRRHFGIAHADLIGHSYVGLMVALYAMRYPDSVGRVVQIGPMEPVAGKSYPPELRFDDGLLAATFARLGQLWQQNQSGDAIELCRRAWEILGPVYVTDPANAFRIDWGRCELPNERNFLRYWSESILPSIKALALTPDSFSPVKAPVLVIHGTKDRNAAYGGGRDWASWLPDARLMTVDHAAHAPWIEAPDSVLGAVGTFFAGSWPNSAGIVPKRDNGI